MCRKNWKERMEKKHWEEMQKLKAFDKENFKGAEMFSRIFKKIFNFFSLATLIICIIIVGVAALIYFGFLSGLSNSQLIL